MSEQKEYDVRRLDEKKMNDLEQLFTSVYKKKTTPNYFLNKYNTKYTGVEYMGYLAYKDEMPIAFYGVIPCFIKYDNGLVLAAQSADTMTHSEYRYKNLFSDLSNKCFNLCKQNGIKLVFGFPNQNSYHGAIKLGWQLTEVMDCFQIPIDIKLFKKIALRIKKINIDNTLKKYVVNENGLVNSVLEDGFSGVNRDENYLEYKTYSKTYVLQIAGSKAWINVHKSITIGDISCNENSFDDLITSIKKIAFNLGITMIYFHACKITFLHQLFSARFESVPSFPVLFQNFTETIDIKKIKFTFADIDIF